MLSLTDLKQVTIAITKKCNLSCIWCYEEASATEKHMDISLLKRLIDEFATLPNFERMALTGGEPFIHPNIREIIDYVFEKKIKKLHITSNGTIDNLSMLENYKNKPISISVSIDGLEETHDKIRGTGNYKKALRNIKKMSDAGFDVRITTTVSKNNLSEIEPMTKALADLGITELKFQRMRQVGHGNLEKKLVLTSAENKQLTELILKLKMQYKNKFYIGYKDPFLNIIDEEYLKNIEPYKDKMICSGCRCGISYLFVTLEGDVFPCPFLHISLGNIKNTGIGYIWQNSKLLPAFRQKNYYSKCKSCKFWGLCRGCRAEAYIHDKNVFGEDPGCWLEH